MSKEQDSTGNALATSEQTRLEELEASIAAAISSFAEAGSALREIRDSRLYRATHATFEAYCQDAWGLTHRHANRLIEASSVTDILGPIGPTPPTEAVARELAPLADKPDEMIGAWQQAVEEHGTPTAAQVRAIVQPPAEVVDVPEAEVEVEPDAPKAIEPGPRVPTRSPSTLASVTRAFNAALDDGWSLEEIGDTIETAHRKRLA